MKRNELGWHKGAKSSFLSLSPSEKRQMGKVHSVFKSSFNIEMDGQLINFSRTGMSLSAHGCVIETRKMEAMLSSLKAGDIVRLKNSVYTMYTENETVSVDLSLLEEVDLSVPDLSRIPADIDETAVYQTLEKMPFEDEVGLELDEQTLLKIDCLRSVYRCDEKKLLDTLTFFIGRGKGLTPSGDDLLVGFALMRKALSGDVRILKAMRECLNSRLTTDVSEAYYEAFFEGFVSSHLKQLVYLLEDKNSEEAGKLICAIGQYGHTSGYDSLYGCYLGLASIINERRDRT